VTTPHLSPHWRGLPNKGIVLMDLRAPLQWEIKQLAAGCGITLTRLKWPAA